MFYEIRRSCVEFKRAFRYCKQHDEQIKADSCEQFLDTNNSKLLEKCTKYG